MPPKYRTAEPHPGQGELLQAHPFAVRAAELAVAVEGGFYKPPLEVTEPTATAKTHEIVEEIAKLQTEGEIIDIYFAIRKNKGEFKTLSSTDETYSKRKQEVPDRRAIEARKQYLSAAIASKNARAKEKYATLMGIETERIAKEKYDENGAPIMVDGVHQTTLIVRAVDSTRQSELTEGYKAHKADYYTDQKKGTKRRKEIKQEIAAKTRQVSAL